MTSTQKYSATPPPPRQMGVYSMVPPATAATPESKEEAGPTESSPKADQASRITQFYSRSTLRSKRLPSPLQQPPKLTRVDGAQAEIRQLRHELELSNRKIASLGQCLQDMRSTAHKKEWEEQQKVMKAASTRKIRSKRLSRQQQQQQLQQQDSILEASPIRRSLGPRTTAQERTKTLLEKEPLVGLVNPTERGLERPSRGRGGRSIRRTLH